MRRSVVIEVATAMVLACATGTAGASPVHATSYSMPNGDGQASGGSLNYWDRGYTGIGATTVDGAPLSGGLGKLTDGVIATQVWNTVSNAAGTGQYVGWLKSVSPNPTIVFTFAATAVINEVDIWLDNSGVGGVVAPSAILIDGVSRAFTAPAAGTVGQVSFTGLDLHGATHTVEFFQGGGNTWTFVSEIAFAVPEPDAAALLGIGLLATLALRRRRSGR